jgi:hypothetical protein
MEIPMSDKRNEMLKAAIADCFKAREPVNVDNVRQKLPDDFFYDHDAGEPLDDATVFTEIQATFKSTAPLPRGPMLITENPDGHKLGAIAEDFSGDTNEASPLENEDDLLPPATAAEREVEAAPTVERTASHVASGPGQSPQARLDAARKREQQLLGERPLLIAAQRNARAALAVAVRTYQDGGPKQTHEDLARDFIAASQREREARARGEAWALPPERKPRGERAYVDIERSYSQGGDANTFARKMARTGNRRGAYSKTMQGQINRDPSRGAVPAPVVTKPAVPALAK